jgi:hypothetical protein
MSNTITPNLGLTVPTVGSELGPLYATEMNGNWSILDALFPSGGYLSSGININADLPFHTYNATNLRTARFVNLGASINPGTSPLDVYNLYWAGGSLYANNGAASIQITAGNGLNASQTGGFVGLAGTSGVASYNNGPGTFTYTSSSAPSIAAGVISGPLTIRDTAGGVTNGVTLASPASLASPYTITLPTVLPATTALLTVSPIGEVKTGPAVAVSVPTLLNIDSTGTVSTGRAVAVGMQTSASSGAFSTSSLTIVPITNLTVTLTTSGRPIVITTLYDGSGGTNAGYYDLVSTAAVVSTAQVQIAVTGGATATIGTTFMGGSFTEMRFPNSSYFHVYTPPAGTYTLQMQVKVLQSTLTFTAASMVMIAYEL